MSKITLTTADHQVINEFNSKYEAGLDALEKAKQLQVGDFLILNLWDYKGDKSLHKNSYGAPIKYKVVTASKHGIPFIKKVNKKGEPIGKLYTCMGMLESDDYRIDGQKFEFELDPDFADSLLLQDQYDPATLHKSKKDIWKSVTEHNKACKVKTGTIQEVVLFFNAVNVGDTLWTSNVSHYLIQDKKTMSPQNFNNSIKHYHGTRIKGPHVIVLTLLDKKGKTKDITADFFHCKALYKERPRTYRELNI